MITVHILLGNTGVFRFAGSGLAMAGTEQVIIPRLCLCHQYRIAGLCRVCQEILSSQRLGSVIVNFL